MGPPPVLTSGAPGEPVKGGSLKIHNGTGDSVTISSLTIMFTNADLFASTTVTGTVPLDPSQQSQNSRFTPPLDNGSTASTEHTYMFPTALTVPSGEDANFSLALTITARPQTTMRRVRAIYAGVFGASGPLSPGLGVLSGVLMLLSLCTTAIGGSRRRLILALLILMLVAASQVGCDNGSVPSSNGGPVISMQSAANADVTDLRTGTSLPVAGLGPNSLVPLSTIVVQ